MINFFHKLMNQIPIRVRLTLWYVLLMALTFVIAGGYLLFRFQHSLTSSIDSALQVAVLQSIAGIEDEDEILAFQDQEERSDYDHQATNPNFAMQLLSTEGVVLDYIGPIKNVSNWGTREPGYQTLSSPGDDEQWRVFSQPILTSNQTRVGWIQAAQSLDSVTDTLQDFRDQFFWLLPLIIILAGLGGYFLASRLLQPIDRITSTAAAIEASDLSQRINYQGPTDEIGRLALTFDRMLERIKSAFERERRFTGDAAHELRTPLTVLKGQIEVTLSRNRSKTEYQDTLHRLASHVDRLIRLSNSLLFLSLSDQKQLSWEPVSLNLTELLTVIIQQIQSLAEEKSQALTAEIPKRLLVYGDTDHLTRLFLNLLENAVKYTPSRGQISIQAGCGNQDVWVSIHNSGSSIPPEHIPHIFERFYRVGADRSSQTGGSGLGLAISREIVRLHGGQIQVQSEPGQGTIFTVFLSAPQS